MILLHLQLTKLSVLVDGLRPPILKPSDRKFD